MFLSERALNKSCSIKQVLSVENNLRLIMHSSMRALVTMIITKLKGRLPNICYLAEKREINCAGSKIPCINLKRSPSTTVVETYWPKCLKSHPPILMCECV